MAPFIQGLPNAAPALISADKTCQEMIWELIPPG